MAQAVRVVLPSDRPATVFGGSSGDFGPRRVKLRQALSLNGSSGSKIQSGGV
jgi:hypothetical protein